MWRKSSQKSNFFKPSIAFIFLSCGNLQGEKDTIIFYVAPNSTNVNPGTRSKPFKTITRARDAARNVESEKQKKVILQGGMYYEAFVELEIEDSGLTIEAASG